MSAEIPLSIPATYQEWRECITIRCGLPLTRDFIERRLRELRSDHSTTLKFRELYGVPYTSQVIAWFEQALAEASG